MKKNRLVVDYEYDFELLGIISPAKDYKLAWNLNKILGIKLVKNQDLKIEFINDKHLIISNYIFETENSLLRLLKNKSLENISEKDIDNENRTDVTIQSVHGSNGGFSGEILNQGVAYLLPEVKNFDYLIMIFDNSDAFSIHDLIKKVKDSPIIQYITKLDTAKLKSKENLIF